MKKGKADRIAEEFNRLNFHDDGLAAIKIYRLNGRTNTARVDLSFQDDATGATKVLSFRDCGNIRQVMDFDVLSDNWFAQTEKAVSTKDVGKMEKFVRAQVGQWHVTYMPPSSKVKPIRKKLSSIKKYVLFRVTFFGGTIEVLARSFTFTK